MRFRVSALSLGLVAGLVLTGAAPPTAAADPGPVDVDAAGTNGVGRINRPGRACGDGGEGSSWHYEYEAPLAPGAFAGIPAELTAQLEVRSDLDHVEHPPGPNAWLRSPDSSATLGNQRGTLRLTLDSPGSGCTPSGSLTGPAPDTFSDSGTWTVEDDAGSGSYRAATGSGTFTLAAGVAPGADNPWSLQLDGTVEVLQPSLAVEVLDTFWGNLGADYLTRRVSVAYRVTNAGPGDAYGARLTAATSPTPGVTPLGPVPQALRDLAAGESEIVVVRYQLGLLAPCALVVLGCEFATTLTAELPDALDLLTVHQAGAPVAAPDLPPPLS